MKIKKYAVSAKSTIFKMRLAYLTEAKTAREAIERTQEHIDETCPNHPQIATKAKIADERFLETAANYPKSYVPYVAVLILLLLSATPILSQTVECPPNLVCISQAAANQAAQNARELEAQKEKNRVLETALADKDKTIDELRTTNAQNVADLKEAIKRTELELARTNGMLTAREAEVVRQSAIITAMIPMLRKKRIGLINIF
jgi:phage-related minor tail protein